MTDVLVRGVTPSESFNDIEEDEIDRAVTEAVWDAIRKHKANGNPIAVWEDGKVKIIQPEDIVLPEDAGRPVSG